MELLKHWSSEEGSVELKLGPLRRTVPMGWNSASEESPCRLVRCCWGGILRLVLSVLESCHLESAAAAGTNCFCPGKDRNRKKQVSSPLSSLTASFYCSTCPTPHQQSLTQDLLAKEKYGPSITTVLTTDNILITSTPSPQSSPSPVYFVMRSLWIIGVLR